MDMERIWRKEARKRSANEARRERVNRNWPIHAQKVLNVLTDFSAIAELDGVRTLITAPEWLMPLDPHNTCKPLGSFETGSSTIILQFGMQNTGEGMLIRTEDGEGGKIGYEVGGQLIIRHSAAEAVVEVYFRAPRDFDGEHLEPLLYTHTYNTDDVTPAWVASLIPKFLAFNRFESRLECPSLFDTLKVRWWWFRDIRNRRGYLDKFKHILTPWELLILAICLAIPFALIQWLWKLIASAGVFKPAVTL